jgi:glutaminyl-tRNA synthetase
LEFSIREDLNKTAKRVMGVLRPIKVVITNLPENHVEQIEAINNPEDPNAGTRQVPFSNAVYIENDDFMENPPKKYFRLTPNGEVRLRYVGIIKCNEVVKDASGSVNELRCTLDPETRPGQPQSGRKVKGTIHWVSAKHALPAEVRLYDRLFKVEEVPDDFKAHMNPNSLEVVTAQLEPSLASAAAGERFQFERLGYFCADARDFKQNKLVFNRTVTLRDSWVKEAAKS